MTAALILAAGASTRLGSPKQLVQLNGETLLDRATRTAHEAGCHPILVVLGASAKEIEERCALRHAEVLINNRWPEGMASSIRLGVAALAHTATAGCVILPSDMPAITPSHLRALYSTGEVTASRYAGRIGVPAFFPNEELSGLLRLEGDRGARSLLQIAPCLDLVGGELDIDTPNDVARMRLTEHPGAFHSFDDRYDSG